MSNRNAVPSLTDERILLIGRQHFKEGANTTSETLRAYCDSVRAVITSYRLAPTAEQAEASSEDAYVGRRMTETLAEVYATIIGDDARQEDESLNAIERVKKAAQVLRLEVDLYRAQREEAAEQAEAVRDAWQPIETAPEGQLLVVMWTDKEDSENSFRCDFDWLEDGTWAKHADEYDHFCCVAPPESRGPREEAPYTHWMPLPATPAASTGEQA